MLPTRGPSLYVVPEFTALELVASSSRAVEWKWPRDRFVRSFLVLPQLGTTLALASLTISIVDENADEIITDGGSDDAMTLLALHGIKRRAFGLQRAVRAGDRWTITIRNRNVANLTIAGLAFSFDGDN